MVFAEREPRVSQLLADVTAEQWPCYTHYDARLVGHMTRILSAASASGKFRLADDAEQEARRVKAAACALGGAVPVNSIALWLPSDIGSLAPRQILA